MARSSILITNRSSKFVRPFPISLLCSQQRIVMRVGKVVDMKAPVSLLANCSGKIAKETHGNEDWADKDKLSVTMSKTD